MTEGVLEVLANAAPFAVIALFCGLALTTLSVTLARALARRAQSALYDVFDGAFGFAPDSDEYWVERSGGPDGRP
jgi:hypothetical protein